ncbi:MAG: asparagine synthase (glutamine-hydrolyzing) [Thermoanaerobaculia bacterium]
MCGICGIVGPSRDADDETRLSLMLRELIPRGPDEEGITQSGRARLGVRRLRVIDLATGSQPMSTPGGRLTALLNGEIYNFRELREELEGAGLAFRSRSDTEVVLLGYDRWGDRLFQKLDGMFAIAIWDASKEMLVLSRDRAGEKPLYYGLAGERFVFASGLRALERGLAESVAPSQEAMARYLFFGYLPSPEGMLAGIRKVCPAEIVTFRNGSIGARRFWSYPDEPRADSPDLDDEALLGTVTEAVRSRLVSDVPIGAFLSGGVDSTLVVDRWSAVASRPRTFSVGFRETSFDESGKARRVAAQLGTDHHENCFSSDSLVAAIPELDRIVDEPLADPSILPTYALSRLARERVTVALSGDGGDELFGGYPTYLAHRWFDLAGPAARPLGGLAGVLGRSIPRSDANFSMDFRLRKFAAGLDRDSAWRHAVWMSHCSPDQIGALMPDLARTHLRELLFEPVEAVLRGRTFPSSVDLAMFLDFSLYLPEGVLRKVDRASMACSLEVRSPLLAPRLIDAATSIRARGKVGLIETKRPLRRLLAGRFPRDLVSQPKKGFGIPVSLWLRTILRDEVRRVLSALPFDRKAVEVLWDEHQSRRENHRMPLWALYVLGRWLQGRAAGPNNAAGKSRLVSTT